MVSANPLTGTSIQKRDALLPSDHVLSILTKNHIERDLYHLRVSAAGYSVSAGYKQNQGYRDAWKNNQMYGEKRALIAAEYYEGALPFAVEMIALIKALQAKDYERAIFLGLLEVEPEDFALASFVCPSKTDFMAIVREGQKAILETGYLQN